MLDLISIFQSNMTPHSVKIILREINRSPKEKQKLNKYIIQNFKFSSIFEKDDILEIQSTIYVILKICFMKTIKMKNLLPNEFLCIDMKNFNYAVKKNLYEIFKNHAHKIYAYNFTEIVLNEKKVTAADEIFFIFSNKNIIKFFYNNEILSLKKHLIVDIKLLECSIEILTAKTKIIVVLDENLKLYNELKNEKSTAVFYEDLNDMTGISTKFMSKYSNSSFHSKDNSFIKKMNFANSIEEIGTPISGKTDDNIFQKNTPIINNNLNFPVNKSNLNISSKSSENLNISSKSSENLNISSKSSENLNISCKSSEDLNISSKSSENLNISCKSSEDLNISSKSSENLNILCKSSENLNILCKSSENNEEHKNLIKKIDQQISCETMAVKKLTMHLNKKIKRKYALLKNKIEKYLTH